MTRREFLAASAAAYGSAGIRIEDDGMLATAAGRFFVLGLYQLPRLADPWQAASKAGFNLVRVSPQQLPLARRHNLYGWVALGSIRPGRESEDEARIRAIVESARHDPALLFWETEDEPTFVWKQPGRLRIPPEQIIKTRRFVEALDPARPFYLNHSPTNLESTLRSYNAGADIVATDIYPVIPPGIRELYALWPDGQHGDLSNPYISQVGQYADKMRRVAGPSRAVFLVLQAFAWEKLREKDQDPSQVRYPTRAETRFMAWQAVVHGVNGILYWGLSYTPPEAPLWGDLCALAAEFRALGRELASRKVALSLRLDYHDTGHSLDWGVQWAARATPGGAVIFAVNADRHPVEVTFGNLGRFRWAARLFPEEPLPLIGGRFRETFPPFGVRIYKLREG